MVADPKSAAKILKERGQKLLTVDHFAALGVARTASAEDVHRAFVEAVKTWHPDRAPAGFDELKPLFTEVFNRLEVARATLSDPPRRVKYLEELAKPAERASAAELATAEAALEFKKAEALFKKNDVANAEIHLRRAAQLNPANVEYQTRLVWLQAKPNSTAQQLQKVVADLDRLIARDPKCARAYFFRGQLRSKLGLAKEAHDDFTKVVALEPANIDAAREIRLYKMRHERGAMGQSEPKKDGEAEGVGGFFRKLLKR